jgi:hypothetical protein
MSMVSETDSEPEDSVPVTLNVQAAHILTLSHLIFKICILLIAYWADLTVTITQKLQIAR